MENQELKDVAFRINAIFDNERTVNIMGFSKNKETGVKTDLTATIWKTKQDGEISKAYNDFLNEKPEKGDLLLTSGDNFGVWKERKQFTIRVISGKIESKFKNEVKEEVVVEAPKQEAPKTSTNETGFINSEEKVVDEVPWELDL